MRARNIAALAAIVATMVCGCASYGNKKIADPKIVGQIEKGKSTKADVKELLGDPATVDFSDAGLEKWIYVCMSSQMRGTSFIPVAGMFVGGHDMETDSLTIQFDKDGVVMNVGTGHTTGGAGGLQDLGGSSTPQKTEGSSQGPANVR